MLLQNFVSSNEEVCDWADKELGELILNSNGLIKIQEKQCKWLIKISKYKDGKVSLFYPEFCFELACLMDEYCSSFPQKVTMYNILREVFSENANLTLDLIK